VATYKEIAMWVRERYGYTPKTCWISDIKAQFGLTSGTAANRRGADRVNPCPRNKQSHIVEALRYFGMIE
jgi:hypothetical protein